MAFQDFLSLWPFCQMGTFETATPVCVVLDGLELTDIHLSLPRLLGLDEATTPACNTFLPVYDIFYRLPSLPICLSASTWCWSPLFIVVN